MADPIVSGQWLAAHAGEVRIVDVRWYLDAARSGRAEYDRGHLPGAVWIDLDTELSEPATTADGRHPLASPDRFAAALGRLGIATGTPVVAYDDAHGSHAARLWWMLHVLGEPVAVLDGGLAAWPGELTTEVPAYPPVDRTPVPWPRERFVTADEVAATSATVLDARSAARYAHGDPAIDPGRATFPARCPRPGPEISTRTAGSFPPPGCARGSPPPAGERSPTAAPASPPATTCSR